MTDLRKRHCEAPEAFAGPLSSSECDEMFAQLHEDWDLDPAAGRISRRLEFASFYETMAFVNAVAWVANREDHHPDLEVSYGHCVVRFSTHAVGGLSPNDFICAARVDALFD
ncbi:MAG: 4a-hydroxytetrahydrobiopterin dehydratase [Thioalkalivibrio sp.]|nr:MAG: 4a-hydroxytetrahydrobiopterin dehydratase [Thioalkalivibrio sp.]